LALLALGDFSRSLRPFIKAADVVTTESLPLSLTGKALVALEKDEQAIDFLNTALQRNPYDPLAMETRGYANFNRGNYQGAVQDLQRLLSLVPKL
jgi:Flp pilus assembly protein TadD